MPGSRLLSTVLVFSSPPLSGRLSVVARTVEVMTESDPMPRTVWTLHKNGHLVGIYGDVEAGRTDLATLRAEYADEHPGADPEQARLLLMPANLLSTPLLTRRPYCPRCHHLLSEHGVREWLPADAAPNQCGHTDGQANMCRCEGPDAG